MRPISKARAAAESALRTFLQTAVPAFTGVVMVSRPAGVTARDFYLSAAISAGAAGLAAVFRIAKPIQTDRPDVAVQGLAPAEVRLGLPSGSRPEPAMGQDRPSRRRPTRDRLRPPRGDAF